MALVISVLAVVICVLAGVTACHGGGDSGPPASIAVVPDAQARSMPAQADAPVPAAVSAAPPGELDPIHAAQLAWPWTAAAEMAASRMKGAPR